jgi:muramidase (phage lysozyme)
VSNVDAFLDCISACEGTAGMDGYRMMFGGKLFYNDWIDHPRVRVPFTDKSGRTLTTSAAGRYQFEIATWDRLARKLWPMMVRPMFSPDNQDAAAIELVAEQGAMPDVKAGNLEAALRKCASQWASLPDSKVPQPTRSLFYAQNAYLAAGGVMA